MTKLTLARTLLALMATALVAAGCGGGGGIPGDSVATVGDTSITKEEYDHWLAIAAKSGGQPDGKIPEPPDFEDCIASKRETLPKPAKGQPTTTDEQLKTQCEAEYTALRDQVLQLLISFEWIEGEAEEQGVEVSDEDVQKQFEEQKKASFPKEEDYTKFLETSGQTEDDILMRVRLDVLSNKIREESPRATTRSPTRRSPSTTTRTRSASPSPSVATCSSCSPRPRPRPRRPRAGSTPARSGPTSPRTSRSTRPPRHRAACCPRSPRASRRPPSTRRSSRPPKGETTGPVKTQFGWYVFRVTKVTEATQQSQEEASETIKQLLASQKQQKSLDDFVKNFTEKWRARTQCADDYKTTDCDNGPKPSPTPTLPENPAGGAPVQPAPQG